MVLNYWSLHDKGRKELENISVGIRAARGNTTSAYAISGFPDVYQMLGRSSDSIETIRPSSRLSPPPPPRQRYAELPIEFDSDTRSSKPKARVPAATISTWSMEDAMIKLSNNIHDGCSDLNTAFDYKYISKEDITGHLMYQQIKLELLLSASRMAREDVEIPPDAKEARTPLLIRHVRSLSDLPHFHAYGDKRELCVAFLTMVSRKRGIGPLSVDKLGQNQTQMYRQIADQLEVEMKNEYDQVYNDAKRKARRRR